MTNQFSADLGALHQLIHALHTFETELGNAQTALVSAYNNFDSSFNSPDKGNLETNFGQLFQHINHALAKAAEIKAGLILLQSDIQDAEHVHF